MKCVVCSGYGPPEVLQLVERPKPVPKPTEVLIKIHATTCHIGDVRVRSFDVPLRYWIPFRLYLGLTKPRRSILGMELAGVIESVGTRVRRFRIGDMVIACTGFSFGANAQYACVAEDSKSIRIGMVVRKPANMTFEEAAAGVTTGGITALVGLRKGKIRVGSTSTAGTQKVMIYGASGSVGTYAVQLSKHFGAEVTGVCSTANLQLVRSLGADKVIDYTREDLSKYGRDYDLVFDAVEKLPSSRGQTLLSPTGEYVTVGTDDKGVSIRDLEFLVELVEEGKLNTVIDRVYPLERIVEAHHYVGKRHKKGHVVLTVEHPVNV